MPLVISPAIRKKIGRDDHGGITEKDVRECFTNHCRGYCYDRRPQHLDREGKPSMWFVAETNARRVLKIMFVRENESIVLKSAYPATETVQRLFDKHCK